MAAAYLAGPGATPAPSPERSARLDATPTPIRRLTPTSPLADLEARARDDGAWLLVVRAYLDGLRDFPGPFQPRP